MLFAIILVTVTIIGAFLFFKNFNRILEFVARVAQGEVNISNKKTSSENARSLGKLSLFIKLAVAILFLAVIAMESYYIVSPGYKAVVFRLGKVVNVTEQGVHLKIPFIDDIDKVMTEKIQRYEFGYRTVSVGPPAKYNVVTPEELMITSDGKIVEVDWVLQFQISDPVNYILMLPQDKSSVGGMLSSDENDSSSAQQKAIRDIAEASFRQVIANSTLDDVLTTGKEKIQIDSRELIQKRLNVLNTGVRVVVVQLQDVAPPEAVRAAYNDVNSARNEREKKILEAQKYSNERQAAASGEVQKIINEAEAYKARRVSVVEGEYNRIMELVPSYQKDPKLLKTTLFIDAAEEFWPKAKIIMVEGGTNVQFLPLDKILPKVVEY